MYDHDFYEQMDSLMVNLLVDLAINMVCVLYATVRYVLMQPIRLAECKPIQMFHVSRYKQARKDHGCKIGSDPATDRCGAERRKNTGKEIPRPRRQG